MLVIDDPVTIAHLDQLARMYDVKPDRMVTLLVARKIDDITDACPNLLPFFALT
jgi:hypothetical protein